MTQIYLARHGETEWNAAQRIQGFSQSDLSELGRWQARKLAARMEDVKLDAIYASDLRRAMDTAGPIAETHGLEIQPMEKLRERGYGDWEGLTLAEVTAKFPEEWHQFHILQNLYTPIPKAETWQTVQTRVVEALEEILAKHPELDATVMIVGHGGSLRMAVLHALNASLETLIHMRLDNTSLTHLEYRPNRGGRVLLLNDTHHLVTPNS